MNEKFKLPYTVEYVISIASNGDTHDIIESMKCTERYLSRKKRKDEACFMLIMHIVFYKALENRMRYF